MGKFDITKLKPDSLKPYIYPKSQKVKVLIDQDVDDMITELITETKKKQNFGILNLINEKTEEMSKGDSSPKKSGSFSANA